MTLLDHEPTNTPSCPRCENRDRVEWDHDHNHWLCCNCWLVFIGDQDEHDRYRDDRQRYRKRAELVAQRPWPRDTTGEPL